MEAECHITIHDHEIEGVVDAQLDERLEGALDGIAAEQIEGLLDDFVVNSSCPLAAKFEEVVVGIVRHHVVQLMAESDSGATGEAARRGLIQGLQTAVLALERGGVSTR